MAKQAFKVPLT